MTQELSTLTENAVSFLAHFGTAVILSALFVWIYTKITPFKEVDLIAQGNKSAAYSFSGATLGFVIALSGVIIHSASLPGMMIWGFIALLVQTLTYLALAKILRSMPSGIEKGIDSYGIFLGGCSIAAGILNAACMTP
ncbi:MAG: DUF350 domain-containing protein [Bacteroidetes bacterium]|nr:DUF350 domain-containing protein [Bacteroidota bacterium]